MSSERQTRQEKIDLQLGRAGWAVGSRRLVEEYIVDKASLVSTPKAVPQIVGQLPWGHIRTIIGKVKEMDVALFYMAACTENGWTRPILELQIEQALHTRLGAAPTNFNIGTAN